MVYIDPKYQKKYREKNRKRRSEYMRQWILQNPEKRKVYRVKFHSTHIGKQKEYAHKWYIKNKEKSKKYHNEWKVNNPDKYKQTNKNWRLNNQDKIKEYQLKSYGINLKESNNVFNKQQGRCAICLTLLNKKMCHDHCHKTDRFRGILCSDCNKLLGFSKDNIDILESAIKYLKQHGEK